MTRIATLIFLLGALASLAAAASAPIFCKCTCFTNSTIIPLGPHKEAPPSTPSSSPDKDHKPKPNPDPDSQAAIPPRATYSSCNDCNKAFCLNYNLPICKDAEEKDVVAMCFQRDSRKDQIIVWGFILGTAGLLGWAGLQRVLEFREKRAVSGIGMGGGSVGARSPGFGRGSSGGGLDGLRSPRDGTTRGVYQAVGAEGEGRGGG